MRRVETDVNTSNCTDSAECVCLLPVHQHEPLTEDFSVLRVQFLMGVLDVFCTDNEKQVQGLQSPHLQTVVGVLYGSKAGKLVGGLV